MTAELRPRHALLLQGPVGPFFARLGRDLRAAGARTTKVNFNSGDDAFYWPGAAGDTVVRFTDPLDGWPAQARALMRRTGSADDVDAVILFGDCRPIHVPAIAIAHELGIPVYVFEEGYLRPDYVTLERDGVNANSRMPRDAAFYRQASVPPAPVTHPVGDAFPLHATWTVLHACAKSFGWWRYPHYVHHRRNDVAYGAFCYARGAARKAFYKVTERGVAEAIIAQRPGRYFVLPLQVYCDSQLSHSDFPSMEAFIEQAVTTFAAHAPADTWLVVKHHPHDVPFRDYRRYLAALGARLGLGERLVYLHDLDLPALLKHARGVVTMNSTVGISALYHRAPVKVLGRALYDIPGLTSTASLADFYRDPGAVDDKLLAAFIRWLRVNTQVNGSFYKRVPQHGTATGLPNALFGAPRRVPHLTLVDDARQRG